MPYKGGKKRGIPRKIYAHKARQQKREKINDGWQSAPNGKSRVSMIDIARNTENRRAWGEQSLRFSEIKFVSASRLSVDDKNDIEWSIEKLGDATSESNIRGINLVPDTVNNQVILTAGGGGMKEGYKDVTEPPECINIPSFAHKFVSNKETATMMHENSSMGQTSSARYTQLVLSHDDPHSASDSSEDIVLFTGRKPERKLQLDSRSRKVQTQTDKQSWGTNRQIHEHHVPPASDLAGFTSDALSTRVQEDRLEEKTYIESDADVAAEDYIANLLEQQRIESNDCKCSSTELHDSHICQIGHGNSDENSRCEQSEDSDYSAEDAINSDDIPPDDSRLNKAKTAMTDEDLARRLAKQEELGFSSSDILLWHEQDMIVTSSGEHTDVDQLRESARRYGKNRKQQDTWRSQGPTDINFENLNNLLDNSYGDFDVTDFERPSLQLGRARGKKNPPHRLLDSELEKRMFAAWENDRLKKKERKEKRELLFESLLDDGNLDEVQRRPNGISLQSLRDEIREFNLSKNTNLSLVPMDRNSRRRVHEIAIMLGLQSKSKGKGLRRYTCLYKTSRSARLDSTIIDSVFAKFEASSPTDWFDAPRGDHRKLGSAFNRRNNRDKNSSMPSYRDGDTVGGNAPALGSDNKGHALLSKMGWTSGTALGAVNNKGSLEPIAQIVKSSRAGLG